jgi:hypothetical protein
MLTSCAGLRAQNGNASHSADMHDRALFEISLVPLGYKPPRKLYAGSRITLSTLDFVDEDHVLVTFRIGQLMQRTSETESRDEGETIHAAVVDLPSGTAIRSVDWRMHDHGQYLWPLAAGKFLLRQENKLMLTDASLELKPFEALAGPLAFLSVSPSRSLLEIETEEQPDRTRLRMIRVAGDQELAEADLAKNVDMPLAIDQSPADASISGQQIEVVDMRSWTTVFSMRLRAVNGAQRNFALSPAGGRVAILTKGAIEVYRLDANAKFDAL